jgi:Metal-dependent hydrolases of the beta-lactamase superfamily III
MTQKRTLVITFLILALCACCLPAGATLPSYSFRGSVIGVSESDNTVTILATHKWGCVYDGMENPCSWISMTPKMLTGTVPDHKVFDHIGIGSSVEAGSIGSQGVKWTGIGILTPSYSSEPLHATDLFGEPGLLSAPLVAGYTLNIAMQPDCGDCSGAICTAQAANVTISRNGAEVWSETLLPGEEAVYTDPADGSGLSILFVSGQASANLCPDTPPWMTGIQPTSIFIVHADGSGPGPIPTRNLHSSGVLSVFSIPSGATILLDGAAAGSTPGTIHGIDPGVYSLVLAKEGYAPYERYVTITAGKPTSVTATLTPAYGSLRIQSAPTGASVLLNGVSAGFTPLVVKDLKPGEYTVSVSKTGYVTVNRSATVAAGQEKLLFVTMKKKGDGSGKTRLVLLGTTGGVSWWPDSDRASSSSALVVGDTIYIVDLGQGSAARLSQAFNKGVSGVTTSTFLEDARALFFTHLHPDHIADYPSLLLTGPGSGLGTRTDPRTGEVSIVPLVVIGPADRGALEVDKSQYLNRSGTVIYTDSANPALVTATPGTRLMTSHIWQAYAQAINDMTLDNAYRDYTKLVEIREIGGNEPGDIDFPVPEVDLPDSITCAAMEPFEVYRDENVVVTAILVDHHQVFPSFAYRFDTDDGSVVFSGDTGADTKGNLEKLSAGADILVHEVIDRDWIDERMGYPEEGTPAYALKTHLLTSHTTIDAVGSVATNCSVDTLVLNHFVPANIDPVKLMRVKQNFTGRLILGEDLMEIGIGQATSSR